MTNYNSTLQSNNTDLQEVLQILQNKAAGGEQATPEISVNSTNGLITAIAGTKSSTYQLAFQPAKTITPSTASQMAVSSGYYTGGNITVAAVPTQSKSVTPAAATQNITPDSGKFLSKVTVAGDSNLVAGNIKSGVSIFGVNGTAQVGGETVVDDVSRAIIERTITEINDNEIKIIGKGAFLNCLSLTAASFPTCEYIYPEAFADCLNLTTVSFPMCKRVHESAFYLCQRLTSVDFPACRYVLSDAFNGCFNLTTALFPICLEIDRYAFATCSSLATISFPTCTKIGNEAFYSCANLTSISFPACNEISAAFENCTNLTTVFLPVCTKINDRTFYHCYNLAELSLPAGTYIGSLAFYFCSALSSLTLGASSVCTLANYNAFSGTPFQGYSSYFSGTPHIYVPRSLVTAYQSATNWTYYSSYFSAIEDFHLTFTVDGIEYQFEEGMTWEDWINSEYNTDGFYINSNYVTKPVNLGIEYRNASGTKVPAMSNYIISPDILYYSVESGANEPE